MTCPHCGSSAQPDARFCPSCGQSLDSGAEATRTSPEPIPARGATSDSDSFAHGRFAPGTLLTERYRIVGRLGAGGMGEVYRADDLKLGQAVALKFLPAAVERDPVRLEKLRAEVRTARQIAHPNVCRVYDVGEADGRGFLTMEYVDGEDLRSLLRRIGRLPEDKALEIARQICAGLAAIHDKDVLHRDLKPANIMLDGRGKVRLTDFGLATAIADAGSDEEIAGTPAYMAPEQLAGEPLSVRTDLYALGLVLWEIFTGQRLQTGESAAAIRDAQPHLPSSLSSSDSGGKLDSAVQRVIARCLEPDPARRPQSAMAVAAALPGGDPLAAALAAGETPSPQMVAAAGDDGGLSFTVAVPLLVTFVVCIVLVGWLWAPSTATSRIPLPNSPEVLASKAREMLDRLGYGDEIGETAYAFTPSPSTDTYQQWLDEQGSGPESWYDDVEVRPALWLFWHRTSPGDLRPRSAWNPVSTSDPPLSLSGMTLLRLDPDGRLTSFDAVPPSWAAAGASSPAPDWRVLFDEAGLDMDAFVETTPEWVGASPSDAREAWIGPGATTGGAELRVEAAAFGGRPVFFRLVAPWTPRPSTGSGSLEVDWRERVFQFAASSLILGVPLIAVVIARKHLRHGRVDTRGATRIAVVVAALAALEGGLTKRAWPAFNFSALEDAAWPALVALLAWSLYAAVEPAVRRVWPNMLVSWTRLLDGRWRDPLVGRDLLIGSTLCALSVLALTSWERVMASFGVRSRLDAAAVVEGYVEAAQGGLVLAFGLALVLVLTRLLLRSERRALVGLVAFFVVLVSVPNPTAAPRTVLMLGVPLVVMTRWGLLSACVFLGEALAFMSFLPIDFSLPPFASAVTTISIVLVLAPGVFGFYVATRGRASGGWLDA